MPVELGLEFEPVVGADRVDAKGELLDDVVDEVDGVLLIVLLINLQRTDARRVDGRILVALYLLAYCSSEV